MRGEIDFTKYSQLLGEGLFADNIILSILDYREKGSLDSKEKETLKRAKKFFEVVITGGKLQSRKLSSADDVKSANTFYSVKSIREVLPRSQFIDHIKEMRNTIKEILNDTPVNAQKIDRLDNFFSSYSRVHFQKVKSVLESV